MDGFIYLLHFEQPISDKHTCQHYLGFAVNLKKRIAQHRHGNGARLTQVATERNIGWTLARAWLGSKNKERRLKNYKNTPKLCPICQANVLTVHWLEEMEIEECAPDC